MSFKDNLLTKMRINALADRVVRSIGPIDSGKKVDKDAMTALLKIGAYTHQKERDLDLYLKDAAVKKGRILVLDNELALYNTTVDDVALRKSPTVKEMVSIRNAIKILNDKDVVVCKKEKSVETLKNECIENLDLTFDAADIQLLVDEGNAALENKYADGVIESLNLFAELLEFSPSPKIFQMTHHRIWGKLEPKTGNELMFGPFVVYSLVHNRLMLMEKPISTYDKKQLENLRAILKGDEKAGREGAQVFTYLKQAVMKTRD